MTGPDWRTSTAGTKVRVALWLHSEIGIGGTFTKAQLRDNFPNVEQVDRRMRDLRDEGWVLVTYREDRSLAPDELRLKVEGNPIWERGHRSQQTVPTAKHRQAVLAADGYMCVDCGVAAGEPYPDQVLRTAKLTVARREAATGAPGLVTLCDRCHAARSSSSVPSLKELQQAFENLNPEEQSRLQSWLRSGRRVSRPEEVLWAAYRRLQHSERADFTRLVLGETWEAP